MGYDMRWRKRDDSEAVLVAAARVMWDQAVEARNALPDGSKGQFNVERAKELGDWDSHDAYDGRTQAYRDAQDAVMAASAEMDDAESSYFRLNIHGMGRYLDLMYGIGMVFDDEPHPPFPDPEAYDTTWEDVEHLEYREDYPDVVFTDDQMVRILKFQAEVDRILDFHGKADTPGIPAHKFGTNDGWHVLPAEAKAAVRIWQDFVRQTGEAEALAMVAEQVSDTGYWLKWISYLTGSITHDGFEVH